MYVRELVPHERFERPTLSLEATYSSLELMGHGASGRTRTYAVSYVPVLQTGAIATRLHACMEPELGFEPSLPLYKRGVFPTKLIWHGRPTGNRTLVSCL